MTTLVTGGAGYIGSHTAVSLHATGRRLVLLDDLSNASPVAVDRIRALTTPDIAFVQGDVADRNLLDRTFVEHDIDEVVHFAAFKAVGESVDEPLAYYRNNLGTTIALAEAMVRHGVDRLVFSSSCTVYGQPDTIPVTEDAPTGASNPYGWTKFMAEQILRDATAATRASLAAVRAAGGLALSYGVFLTALSAFLIVAFVLFMVVKAMNRMKREQEAAPPPAPPAPSKEEVLLTEIRDLLKANAAS